MKIITDNQEIELDVNKIISVNLSEDKEFIYFDKLKDGTWRMVHTKGTIYE